jgi:hypothetical protein
VTPYNTLLKAVQDARIFRRNRRPLRSKILACLLYLSGLSYRGMTYQTGMIDASHVSVFRWVHAMRGIVSRVPRKERKLIAIDETKLKINGRQVFVWAAIDADTKELLAVYASYYRSSINQHPRLPQEGPGDMLGKAGSLGGRRPMVSMGARQDGDTVAPHHVRLQERDREVLQDDEGEDQTLLQQPAFG